jgi:hypothetical protein
MGWYRVTKKINGRFYDYWQRTYRVGKAVKTENKYIGPASRSAAPALCSPTYSMTAPRIPEEVITQLNPYAGPSDFLAADFKRWRDETRREDELIQYGPLKARLKRQRQKFLAAKRRTRGIKSLNPFIAQALLNKKR